MPGPWGLTALSKFQAALESTRGTPVPATRIQPLNGWMVPMATRNLVHEQRNSFIDVFRSFQVKQWAELKGLTTSPTFEDLPWFLQGFLKGGVTGSVHDTTAYTYLFTPTAAADDLKTVTWEVGDDTQAFQLPFGIGDKLELTISADKPAVMTCDYLAQQATKHTFTGALTDRVTNDINGALATATIDATTIGTTAVTNVLDAKLTLTNNWTQLWRLDGNLFPGDAYRKPRSAQLALTLQFANTTEYDAFLTAPAERKIRLKVLGPVITGSTGKTMILQIDWYGYWDTFPLVDQGGIHVAQAVGTSHYDTTAAYDFSISVDNSLVTLP